MGSADRFLRGSAHAQSPTGAALSRVIGHRGARNRAPENTIAALRAAKELGCAWVEMDVMLTKDKIPVLHHDNDLARCTDGKGSLWDFTIDEIESSRSVLSLHCKSTWSQVGDYRSQRKAAS